MADTEKVIKLLFKGDGRNLSATTKALQRDFANFERSADAIAQPLNKAFTSVLKLDAAAAALTATLITLALRSAGQFETAFNKTAAIIETSDENLNKFRQDLLEYATDSTASLESITNATFNAVSAGIAFEDVIGSLGSAEKLATAGQADLNEVLQLVAKTINTYGLDASEAGRLTEIFFETNKLGITTITELSNTLSGVTSTAAVAGVSIEEITAGVATLTAAGKPTSEAVTGINAALTNIIKPSKQAREAAEQLGIDFSTTALKSKGLQAFLLELFDAADGNVDVLAQLFGSVQALGTVAVLGENANNKYVDSLKAIENSAGNVDRALVKVGESFDQTNQTLINNIEVTLIKVGDRLERGYANVAKSITEIFKQLGVSIDDGAFDELFGALDETADRLSAFIRQVAASLPEALAQVDFDKLTDAITSSGDAIASLIDGFDPSDPEDLADSMQLVVDSLGALIQVSVGFLPIFEQVFSVVKEASREFSKADVDTQQLVGTALALAASFVALGPVIGVVVAGLAALEGVGIQTAGVFQLLFGAITLSFNVLKSGVQAAELVVLKSISFMLAGFELIPGSIGDSVRAVQIELETMTKIVEAELVKSGGAMDDGAASIGAGFDRIIDGADGAAIAITDYTVETEEAADATEDTSVATTKLAKELGFIKDESEAVVVAEKERGKVTRAVTTETKAAAEEVDKFGLALRKITATEFKAQLEFDAAKVKAQAQVISSAFEATASAIDSATVATVGLVNALKGAGGSDRLFILDQIRLQNEFQQRGIDQQQELLDAMRERIALQRDFLTGDNALEFSIRAPDNINGILEQFYLELLKDAKFFLTTEEGGKVITSGLLG
jgi:TP901 family phage tail tape measure protein